MDYSYDVEQVRSLVRDRLSRILPPQELKWLDERLLRFLEQEKGSFFNLTFSLIPRFIGKAPLTGRPESDAAGLPEGVRISDWPAEQLARTWWLLHLPSADEDAYCRHIETLFSAAEMNEQVALYAALPLFAYGERFKLRASEGVRTSLGVVFDAIALDNPYPAQWMAEAPWNQLVLKAFFMGRPIRRIYGLEKRNNQPLAHILSDYAHERWAASRPVDPWLWKPIIPFLDARIFPDIVRLSQSQDLNERKAAALVLNESPYPEARRFLEDQPELKRILETDRTAWSDLSATDPH